jgi:hypothetical protein
MEKKMSWPQVRKSRRNGENPRNMNPANIESEEIWRDQFWVRRLNQSSKCPNKGQERISGEFYQIYKVKISINPSVLPKCGLWQNTPELSLQGTIFLLPSWRMMFPEAKLQANILDGYNHQPQSASKLKATSVTRITHDN